MISVDALCKRARARARGERGRRAQLGRDRTMLYSGRLAYAGRRTGENAETARRKPMNKRRILEDRHFSCSRIQPRASFVSGNVACSSPQDSVSRGVMPVGKRKKEGRRRKRCWCNVADYRIFRRVSRRSDYSAVQVFSIAFVCPSEFHGAMPLTRGLSRDSRRN